MQKKIIFYCLDTPKTAAKESIRNMPYPQIFQIVLLANNHNYAPIFSNNET